MHDALCNPRIIQLNKYTGNHIHLCPSNVKLIIRIFHHDVAKS